MPPTTQHVRPGAGVHIVLKKDQPTGRTVSGIVGEVLTRGNHPRGIKVRLVDGRVGRVQAMNLNVQSVESVGLDAYVTPGYGGRQRGRKGRGVDQSIADVGEVPAGDGGGGGDAGVIRCPVCEVFEGDEAAVAHHVAGHFD